MVSLIGIEERWTLDRVDKALRVLPRELVDLPRNAARFRSSIDLLNNRHQTPLLLPPHRVPSAL